ncbi:hypothetical protein PL8927_750077 [Planktothrix serta PCC 8927]|uniref:Uncharacterized protein n=1 Tax=Planktothrix serta PCC 8927 TaxID=671068 RepID=A0A7Z9E2C9_9CYAN|nr:hypothetical protein [Planktothrix serta]VXD22400.1 hypothetical protein PL8927_750077 [Planktothrix serta PCC 8927]
MTSASVAVKRLQSESLQQKTLSELKQDAAEMGLSKEDVKQFGSLTYKQTWLTAIGDAIAREFEATETVEDIAVQPNEDPTTEPEATEIACLIDHPALCEGELREPAEGSDYLGSDDRGLPTHWALFDEDAGKVDIYSLKESDPITPIVTIGNIGEKMLTLTQPSATPLRDELTERMRRYVGETMTPQEFEALQHEPLDEMTAAIYLGWLEGSGQDLIEALAA